MSDLVLVKDYESVRVITLNRPDRLNAVNPALLGELNGALQAATAEPSVGAIVLNGAGRAFCAGDDLVEQEAIKDLAEAEIRRFSDGFQEVTRHIMLADKVVICAVQGWAVGGAFSWPINADFSIWADDARAFFPELSYGIFVTGGVTYLLPRLVGRTKAHEMLYLSRKYNAAALVDCGLAAQVVTVDALEPTTMELARTIANLPATARGAMKRSLTQPEKALLEEALARETDAVVEGMMDPETYRRIAEVSDRGKKK